MFPTVRGHVRRAIETANNLERRSLDSPHLRRQNSAETGLRTPALFLRGSPDPTTLESATKSPADMTIADVSEQEVYFGEASDHPGVPVAYRSSSAKASNPERLNLDRRNLPVLPLLEGEHMLRLLNLQNNSIRRIENLINLPNLIFLDLYNNRIDRLENFQVVPNLRVLMLGKNRLKKIGNLACLKKLDVLDLHSNDIERMEDLNELTEMRVLNLGSNRITTLEGIDKLHLLTELNLRRNAIASINNDIGRLPSLQRLFLSNNKLDKLEALEPLLQVASIVELRLDNNGASESNTAEYRAKIIKSFPLLKHLDLKQLSETERKEGLLFYSQAKAATKEREELESLHRTHVITQIKLLWDKRSKRPLHDATQAVVSSTWKRVTARDRLQVSTASEDESEVQPTSREDAMTNKTKTGYSEVEVHGDYRVLAIYGDALDALESAKFHATVHAVKFRYIAIDRVAAVASSATSTNLKLFARLRRLNFAHNDIDTLDQLDWLGSMGSRAEELFVAGNSVCTRSLLRQYVAARITTVARLNGREITSTERTNGKQLFHKTSRAKTSDGMESANAKGRDRGAHRARAATAQWQRTTAPYIVHEIVACATDADKKSGLVDGAWNLLLSTLVNDTLQEISQRDGDFLSGCLDGL